MTGVTMLIHVVTRMPPLSVIPDQFRFRQRTRELPFPLFACPLVGGVCIQLNKGSST